MDLRQLRYFVAVAEELHYGRAAARLCISQPALSCDVKKLESELNVQLLARNNKAVTLTGPGRVLLEEARHLLLRAEQARRLTSRAGEAYAARLRVGFVNSVLHRGLPRAAKTFEEKHPDSEVVMMEMYSAEQAQALQRGQIDIGFVYGGRYPDSVVCESVLSEPFLCCLPSSHRLATKARVDLASLADEDFILFPRNVSPHYYDSIISRCVAAGFSPIIRHEPRLWQSVVAMVSYEMGVALVPQTLSLIWKDGVRYCTIKDKGGPSELYAIRLATTNSLAVQEFVAIFKRNVPPIRRTSSS